MLDSTTSDEVGVISVDLATDSDTSTLSLLASDDDGSQHHPDEMQDHDGATLGAHHTGTVNHQGSFCLLRIAPRAMPARPQKHAR